MLLCVGGKAAEGEEAADDAVDQRRVVAARYCTTSACTYCETATLEPACCITTKGATSMEQLRQMAAIFRPFLHHS